MPDWKRIVSENMPMLNLPFGASEDVVAELAAHLDEIHEDAQSRGLTEPAAVEAALLEVQKVKNWSVLAADIRRAKSQEDPMNTRTKSLWLPALATLFGASVTLLLLQRTGVQPRLIWLGSAAMLFYWPWLAALPIFGAFGAYASQRAHAPVKARLAAALSPALVLFVTLCLILPWALAVDGFSALRLGYFALTVLNWVAIPGVALLLGATPFLRSRRTTQA